MRSPHSGNGILENVRKRAPAARRQVRRGTSKVKSFIRTKPLLSTLLGGITGCVLAMLVRSRR